MSTLTERVNTLLSEFHVNPTGTIQAFDTIYAPDMRFIDPLQEISGRDKFRHMNERLAQKMAYIRFDDVKVTGEEPFFMARWTMVMRGKRGPEAIIPGASEFRTENGLIVFQHDYWDILGSFMSALPAIQPLYKRLISRLG